MSVRCFICFTVSMCIASWFVGLLKMVSSYISYPRLPLGGNGCVCMVYTNSPHNPDKDKVVAEG